MSINVSNIVDLLICMYGIVYVMVLFMLKWKFITIIEVNLLYLIFDIKNFISQIIFYKNQLQDIIFYGYLHQKIKKLR